MARAAASQDSKAPVCRLLVTAPAAGAWNMAVDEALLHAAAHRQQWSLRFYGWSEPTLSLGYFQAWDDRRNHSASLACACVRRNSGGGAILHDQELTYSLAVPPGHRLAHSAETLYRAMHGSLVELLEERFGLAARQFEPAPPGAVVPRQPQVDGAMDAHCGEASEPFLCFQRRARGDVIVDRAKIAGSAQRRWHGAVLQHGSILLRRSRWAPELDGLDRFGFPPWDGEQLARAWLGKLSKDLPVEMAEEELCDADRQHAEQIARQRYGQDDWTRKR